MSGEYEEKCVCECVISFIMTLQDVDFLARYTNEGTKADYSSEGSLITAQW